MIKQVHVEFHGKVQGVGFRYTARDVAQTLGVNGWVRNCPDGSVEITAEAEEDILKQFIERLHALFSRYIQDDRQAWGIAIEGFRDFEIRR